MTDMPCQNPTNKSWNYELCRHCSSSNSSSGGKRATPTLRSQSQFIYATAKQNIVAPTNNKSSGSSSSTGARGTQQHACKTFGVGMPSPSFESPLPVRSSQFPVPNSPTPDCQFSVRPLDECHKTALKLLTATERRQTSLHTLQVASYRAGSCMPAISRCFISKVRHTNCQSRRLTTLGNTFSK